jgi:WD40 repeat protein
LACSDVYAIRFWSLKTGAESPNRIDARESQWGMTFSPDGKLLYTGGSGKVNVWDVAKQQRIATLETTKSYSTIRTIAVSDDGRFTATIGDSAGQTLQVFHAPKP